MPLFFPTYLGEGRRVGISLKLTQEKVEYLINCGLRKRGFFKQVVSCMFSQEQNHPEISYEKSIKKLDLK